MPKDPPKPQTVRIPVSFPDPDLVDLLDAAVRASADHGEPPNRSAWVRKAIRAELRRQKSKVPA